MEPEFVINTKVTEQQYRKGLRGTMKKTGLYIGLIYSVALLIYVGYNLFKLATGNYYADGEFWFWTAVMTVLAVLVLISALRFPKKAVDKAIDMLVSQTGSAEMDMEISFFDDKTAVKHRGRENLTYILYADIIRIADYSDFLIFESKRKIALYVAKKDIDDLNGFYSFMHGKCPSAKLIKK